MAGHISTSENKQAPRDAQSRGALSRPKVQRQSKKQAIAFGKQQVARKRSIRVFITVLVIAISFSAGFFVRSNTQLMYDLGIISSVNENEVNPGMTVSGSTYDSISARIAEIEGIINKYSLDSYELDTATSSLINSLINSTGDKYLRYYSQDRYQALLYDTTSTSDYAGIGVLFGEYNGQAYAVDVFEDSVAQFAGVTAGDFIVAINGDRTQNWTSSEVAQALSKDEGASVVVTWRRPVALEASGGEEFTTTLSCKKYSETNVTTELSGAVGYINIKQISSNASDLVSSAITSLISQGAKAFVLDLRDVPGGYFSQACDIADLFLKSGIISQVQTTDGTSNKTATATNITDAPLVVIINGNTAGAAEVLASALKENDRATLVGVKSMGKGSVQIVRELSFGGALRYTAAYYRTPLGHDIDGVGVSPNITISNADTQKSIAMDSALSKL